MNVDVESKAIPLSRASTYRRRYCMSLHFNIKPSPEALGEKSLSSLPALLLGFRVP